MKIQLIIFICLISMFFSINLLAQCPSGGGPWSSGTFTKDIGWGESASVDYEHRGSGGSYDLKIDWSTLSNNSQFIRDAAWKKILEQELVTSLLPVVQEPSTRTVNLYYETECKATLVAKVEVDKSYETCCPEGISESFGEYIENINGVDHFFVNVTKSITCGMKCCKRVYTVKSAYDIIEEIWYNYIDGVETFAVNSCDPTSEYLDCDGNPIPCIDGSCD